MSIDQSYNQWAASYDSNINKTRDLDKLATQKTLDQLSFVNVLELGCGTGKNTAYLLTKAEAITAIDFSQEMLNIAKQKINSDRVTFIQEDLTTRWAIPNNTFDLITCNLVLEHISDLHIVFSQVFDKLKPSGLFFISELHPSRQYRGSQAKFETENGTHFLEVFSHHISDYIDVANQNQLELSALNEWFDDNDKSQTPRLISFLFKKK